MEKIVAEYKAAGKDWQILNEKLALGAENLSDKHIYFIKIKPGDPRFSYRIPNGNELGAYAKQWIPGGITKCGTKEAALEDSEIIKTQGNIQNILKEFENRWEQLQ